MAAFSDRIVTKQATIGIVGLGYVGLPLAIALRRQTVSITAVFDIDV